MFRKYEDTLKQRSFCCDDARVGNNQNYWPELLAEKKKKIYIYLTSKCKQTCAQKHKISQKNTFLHAVLATPLKIYSIRVDRVCLNHYELKQQKNLGCLYDLNVVWLLNMTRVRLCMLLHYR